MHHLQAIAQQRLDRNAQKIAESRWGSSRHEARNDTFGLAATTKFLTHHDARVKSGDPRAVRVSGLGNTGQTAERRSCVTSEGWAGGNFTRLPRPVTSCSATALAWTGPSSRVASSVSHHLPSLGRPLLRGWPGRPSPSWSSLFDDRQPAALPDRSFSWGAEPRKTATLVPSRGSFARRHMLDTLADWWGLQRHCGGIGGRGLFTPQLTCPGSSWEQGSHLPCTPTGRLRQRQS